MPSKAAISVPCPLVRRHQCRRRRNTSWPNLLQAPTLHRWAPLSKRPLPHARSTRRSDERRQWARLLCARRAKAAALVCISQDRTWAAHRSMYRPAVALHRTCSNSAASNSRGRLRMYRLRSRLLKRRRHSPRCLRLAAYGPHQAATRKQAALSALSVTRLALSRASARRMPTATSLKIANGSSFRGFRLRRSTTSQTLKARRRRSLQG